MHVVIGLGNPGPRYAGTRHNIGFEVVEQLAAQGRGLWSLARDTYSEFATIELVAQEVLLVKPQTYMNRSGVAVHVLCQRLELTPEELLVVLDDYLLDFGQLRFRRKGRDGGHNGLASVLEKMQTQSIARLRLGIGTPPDEEGAVDYVLSPFRADEPVADFLDQSCQAIEVYVAEGIEAAMNRFNSHAA